LLETRPPREAAYNLAQPEIVPLRGFLERVAAAAGLTPRFVEVDAEEARAAGVPASFAPFQGPWTSVLDPARAASEWGFCGTRLDDYLAGVVRWHLENRPQHSHPGYAGRAAERELAARHGVNLAASRGGSP
jgi:nucleoside-diphosphate-sugar epimerase